MAYPAYRECEAAYRYLHGTDRPRELTKAFTLFEKAAKAHNPEAQLALSRGYRRGHWSYIEKQKLENPPSFAERLLLNLAKVLLVTLPIENPNQSIAERWLQKAVQQGYLPAQYEQECITYNPQAIVIPPSYEEWLKTQDSIEAEHALGYLYEKKGDEKEALNWFKKAAFRDSWPGWHASDSWYKLGVYRRDGTGCEIDEEAAFVWLKKAASRNHPKAFDAFVHFCQKAKLFHLLPSIDTFLTQRELPKELLLASYYVKEGMPSQIPYETLLEAAARDNVADAQYELSTHYFKQGNSLLALEWLERAGQQHHSKAQRDLLCRYRDGYEIPKDPKRYIYWLRRFAERNCIAKYELGNCLKIGKVIVPDLEESFVWFQRAADLGHHDAIYEVGCCYRDGRGVEPDEEKAIEWLEKHAKKFRFNQDSHNLAIQFRDGKGSIQPNQVKAIEWYERAARESSAICHELAHCFFYGRGSISQSEEQAIRWFQEAATKKNPKYPDRKILQELALCFRDGKGCIRPDSEKAVEWFERAVDSPNMEYDLAIWFCSGKGAILPNRAKALKWLESAAGRGHQQARFDLAKCYELGLLGAEKDDKQALHWFRKAGIDRTYSIPNPFEDLVARANLDQDPESCYLLGEHCLRTGDKQRAIELLEISVAKGHPKANKLLAYVLWKEGDLERSKAVLCYTF